MNESPDEEANAITPAWARQGYPAAELQMELLEEDLLKYSNGIRLADDLTLIEIRIHERRGGRGGV